MKGMAAEDPPNRLEAAFQRSVLEDCQARMLGAGGLEAARSRQEGRQKALVEGQQEQQRAGDYARPPSFGIRARQSLKTSASSSAKLAFLAVGFR